MTVPASASVHPATWKHDYVLFHAESLAGLHAWLAANHATEKGMWFVSWKPATGRPAVPYPELCEELLCWGWIDSTASALDEDRRIQLCTPRKPRSTWTRLNRRRIEEMDAAGRMQPAGWAAVERAKANGWWTILEPVEDLVEPPELTVALDAVPAARAAWDAFPPSARKQMLWSVYSAMKPETRDGRVERIVADASEGRRTLG